LYCSDGPRLTTYNMLPAVFFKDQVKVQIRSLQRLNLEPIWKWAGLDAANSTRKLQIVLLIIYLGTKHSLAKPPIIFSHFQSFRNDWIPSSGILYLNFIYICRKRYKKIWKVVPYMSNKYSTEIKVANFKVLCSICWFWSIFIQIFIKR